MLIAVLILIAVGLYVCIKKEVHASSKCVIRGRPALHIGVALMLGGFLAVLLPAAFDALGLLRDFVGSLLLSIATMFASLVYVAVIMFSEKRRQADEIKRSAPEDKGKT
jgi:nitrate reductase gamma subunit